MKASIIQHDREIILTLTEKELNTITVALGVMNGGELENHYNNRFDKMVHGVVDDGSLMNLFIDINALVLYKR